MADQLEYFSQADSPATYYVGQLLAELRDLLAAGHTVKVETTRTVALNEPIRQQTVLTIEGFAVGKPQPQPAEQPQPQD